MENFKGKKIVVFYDDGKAVARKEGILTDIAETVIFLETINGSIGIPTSRLIRMELVDKSKNSDKND